jgi:serine protease inhibitor
LHFLILVPDKINGLPALEAKIRAGMLADCAKIDTREVILHLMKFELEPPTLSLSQELQALGMKTAFDLPKGSANFDRLAARKPTDYLFISDILHKTYIGPRERNRCRRRDRRSHGCKCCPRQAAAQTS